MIEINTDLINELLVKAEESQRKRINYDLRTSAEDGSQRLLNAMLPETVVPIHRHPNSNENIILLSGKLDWIICNDDGTEIERVHLDSSKGKYGCVVPPGVWHTVEVLEPSVIFGAMDGKYGEDGSEVFLDYCKKMRIFGR